MRVISRRDDGRPRTVELDSLELAANERWGKALMDGHTIADAVRVVRSEYPGLDDHFYEWLGHPH